MTLTEKEIYSQYEALKQTYDAVLAQKDPLRGFFEKIGPKSITFIGCGSSYSICKSAALSARLRLGIPCTAYSAGDLLLNFERFAPVLKDTLLISLSRSGSTSEVVLLVQRAKAEMGIPCLSVCEKAGSPLAALCGYNLEIPWAFDESVCQTRSVSNLYLAALLTAGIWSGDDALVQSCEDAIAAGDAYMAQNRPVLERAAGDWNRVVVLADGELEGIAEEAALAFNEIAMLHSHSYHLLDVRHGPMVLVDSQTLVIAVLSPGSAEQLGHQVRLLKDIKAKGSTLIVFCDASISQDTFPFFGPSDVAIRVPARPSFAAQGLPFIYIAQALSLFKALASGGNPDQPNGLNPWIKL